MTPPRRSPVLSLAALLFVPLTAALGTACSAPSPGPPAAASRAGGSEEPAAAPAAGSLLLRQALDDVWEKTLEEALYLRLQYGLPVEELPDLSHAQAVRDSDFAREMLGRLGGVDPAALSHDEVLSLRLLSRQLEMEVEALRFFWHDFLVTPYTTPLTMVHRVFTESPLEGVADLQRYRRLLGQYPRLIAQIEEHLRQQRERGILLPRAELDVVVPMIRSWARDPASSLFAVAPERLSGILPEAAEAFRGEVEGAIHAEINPALTALAASLDGEYRQAAPEAVGLWQYPEGEDCYRFRVRLFTTLDDLGPEQIHETGLAEVARLERRMAELRRQLGFTGSKAEFHRTLREDPRFRPATAEAIGERLMAHLAEIEPRVTELFSLTPDAPYGVARLDPTLEGGMTFGYYRPPTEADPRGLYFYNGSQPEKRSLIWAQSLIYHELVPGHHFQISLQQENDSLHPLRRESFLAAFTEGWAEYAAGLGHELGLYDDPYDLYGRYAQDIFLAVRLVVDTGIHHRRWSRERAIETMREHTLESDVQIASETLRYGVDMPAQALAYKIGELEIQALRRKAEAALGEAFDVRDFHAAVLSAGALPLAVLREHVEHYVRTAKAGRGEASREPSAGPRTSR